MAEEYTHCGLCGQKLHPSEQDGPDCNDCWELTVRLHHLAEWKLTPRGREALRELAAELEAVE